MGWLFSPYCVRVRRRLVSDLARFTELVLLERYSYAINFAYALLLYISGEVWRAADTAAGTSGFQLRRLGRSYQHSVRLSRDLVG